MKSPWPLRDNRTISNVAGLGRRGFGRLCGRSSEVTGRNGCCSQSVTLAFGGLHTVPGAHAHRIWPSRVVKGWVCNREPRPEASLSIGEKLSVEESLTFWDPMQSPSLRGSRFPQYVLVMAGTTQLIGLGLMAIASNAVAVGGCGSPQWEVVHEAAVNPLFVAMAAVGAVLCIYAGPKRRRRLALGGLGLAGIGLFLAWAIPPSYAGACIGSEGTKPSVAGLSILTAVPGEAIVAAGVLAGLLSLLFLSRGQDSTAALGSAG